MQEGEDVTRPASRCLLVHVVLGNCERKGLQPTKVKTMMAASRPE